MTPQVISLSSATSTAWIPVDYKQNPFNIGLSLVFSNTPNLTCKVEYTLDNVFDSSITPTAFTHTTLSSVTTNNVGSITSPIKAFRLTVTSWTSGTVTLTALQGIVNPTVYTTTPSTIDSFYYDEIFVIGGQSNASGRGVIDASVSSPSPTVLMLDKGESISIASEPTHIEPTGWIDNVPDGVTPGTPAHSFGVEMGKVVSQLTGIRSILVPCAIGSTSLIQWLPAEDPYDRTTLFGAMNYRTESVKKSDRDPVFCWSGHETGSNFASETLSTGTTNYEYYAFLLNLFTKIREYYPDAPLLYTQLSVTNDYSLSSTQRKASEQQRWFESDGSGNVPSLMTDTLAITASGTNGTNTITLVDNTVAMVGDGSTNLAFIIDTPAIVTGKYYAVRMKVTGTGKYKITDNSGNDYITNNSAADEKLVVFKSRTNKFRIYRYLNGEATNLVFTFISIHEMESLQGKGNYMVVTHDLPRNAGADNQHISAVGNREIGRRFGLAYAERVLRLPGVDGTGPRLVSITSTDATHTKVKFTQTIAAAKSGETNYGDGTDSLFRVYDAGTEKTVSSVAIDGADDTALIITHASCSGVRVVTYGDRAGQDASSRKGVVYNTLPLPLPAPMFGPVVSV